MPSILSIGIGNIDMELVDTLCKRDIEIGEVDVDNIQQALNIIKEKLPEVVIANLDSPEIDGWALYDAIKQDLSKYIYFIFLKNDLSDKEIMRAMLEKDCICLQNPLENTVLQEELRKIFRKDTQAIKKMKKVALKGDLARMSIEELLQVINNSQKTGILRIKASMPGTVYVNKGNIENALWGRHCGSLAFYKIFALTRGTFEFEEYTSAELAKYLLDGSDLENSNVMSLIFNGMRIKDDIKRIRELHKNFPGEYLDFLEDVVLRELTTIEDLEQALKNSEVDMEAVEILKKSEDDESACPLCGNLECFISSTLENAGILDHETAMQIMAQLRDEKYATKLSSLGDQKKIHEKGMLALLTPDKSMKARRLSKNTKDNSDIQSSKISYILAQHTKTTRTKERLQDSIFKRLLLALDLLDNEQLHQCIQDQVKLRLQNKNIYFSEILVRKGIVDANTLQHITRLENEHGEPLVPNYRIVKILGEGGLAAVYQAYEIDNEQNYVAIKVFVPPMSDTSASVVRFIREGEVAKKLQHDNIVKTFEFGEFYGLYYIAMEYIDGVTLTEKIVNEGQLKEKAALKILEEILQGLLQAWKQGYIHRDIKPDNIMIGANKVKICDFGLAKSLDEDLQLTQFGAVLGTPHYMSPEQFNAEELDYRTDVYSMGVTLYAMLTGHLPFAGTTQEEVRQSHLNAIPPFPSKYDINVSKPLIAYLFKLLSKHREDRCKTPQELWENLQRVKNGKYPKGGVRYFRKKQQKKIFTISTIFLFALVAIGVVIYWPQLKENWIATNQSQANNVQNLQNQAKNKQEKVRLEREKKKIRLEQEKEQAKLQREKEQAKLQREKEQAKLQREKENMRLEREKQKARLQSEKLDDIEIALDHIELKSAGDKIARLESKMVKNSRLVSLKATYTFIKQANTQLSQKNYRATLPLLQKLQHEKKFAALDSLLDKYLREDISQRQDIIDLWLQLGKTAKKRLAVSREKDYGQKWMQDVFIHLSGNSSDEFLAELGKSKSPDAVKFSQHLISMRQMLASLKAVRTKSKKLRQILKRPHSSQLLTDVGKYLSKREKTAIIKQIPRLSRKLSSKTFRVLTSYLRKEKDSRLRSKMAIALASARRKICDRELGKMLADSDVSVRIQVVKSLAKRKQYKLLGRALQDREAAVRRETVKRLAKAKNRTTESLLIQALSDSDVIIRESASISLGNFKSKAVVNALCASLQDSDTKVCKNAALSLGKIGDTKAVSYLVDKIEQSGTVAVGISMIQALGKIRNHEAIKSLVQLLDNSRYASSISKELISIGKPAVTIMIQTLGNAEKNSQRQIVKILKQIGASTVPAISKLLSSTGNFSLQKTLIKLLGDMKDPGAIGVLGKMLSEKKLKRMAKKSLEKIAGKLSKNDPNYKKIQKLLQ